ncbi:MAG: ABC transporter ATP-binding protein [Rhodoferax sp.]
MLSVRHLYAGYDGRDVVRNVSFDVGAGEVVALLGRNGCGRSTLAKALVGQIAARGSVSLNGRPVLGLPAHAVARAGLGYVPESRELFADLSVEQNLVLGLRPGQRASTSDRLAAVYAAFPVLQRRRHTPAGVLSGGEQQVLALCRTLMSEPDFLLIDEPAEGLAPAWLSQVQTLLGERKRRGVGMLLIEQRLSVGAALADRCLVFGRGALVWQGSVTQLTADARVQSDWLALQT